MRPDSWHEWVAAMTVSYGSMSSAKRISVAALALARRVYLVLSFVIALLAPAISVNAADDAAQYKQSQGLAVYLGVLPAAMVKGHDPHYAESTMHGGVPAGSHEYHLLVAVFEESSGLRIVDAEVSATVTGLGHVGGTRLQLEPMRIEDTVTYGNFINFPGADLYTIKVSVRRSAALHPVAFEFSYDHQAR